MKYLQSSHGKHKGDTIIINLCIKFVTRSKCGGHHSCVNSKHTTCYYKGLPYCYSIFPFVVNLKCLNYK